MTYAEICLLNEVWLDKVQALKQGFDVAFEALVASGSKENLQKVEVLKQQIETELQSPLIARNVEQISNKTLVYIGKLEPGMFKNFPKSIERVYTSFPDAGPRLERLEIGGKTRHELLNLFKEKSIRIDGIAESMMNGPEFITGAQPESVDLIQLRVSDLGLSDDVTTANIYERIHELGLELCPPEVGPHYRLSYQDQSVNDWVHVGMTEISAQDEGPSIFRLLRYSTSLWLKAYRTKRDSKWWGPDAKFVFRIRRGT